MNRRRRNEGCKLWKKAVKESMKETRGRKQMKSTKGRKQKEKEKLKHEEGRLAGSEKEEGRDKKKDVQCCALCKG